MATNLTTDSAGAIAITPATPDSLSAWLDQATADDRAWLKTLGFKAEPGTFVFVPGGAGKAARVVAGVPPGERVWAFAGLPRSLPEGTYRIDAGLGRDEATDAALGWALGSYQYSRYKAPKRACATLLWPERADRAEVERLAAGMFLARDLVNTPAEHMGPDELAAAARDVARDGGVQCAVIRGDERRPIRSGRATSSAREAARPSRSATPTPRGG